MASHIPVVNVGDAVHAVLRMVEPQLTAKRVAATAHVPSGLQVRADHDKLRQILLNLLTNAIKFTESGGSITLDAPTRAGAPAGMMMIRVTDTGIGVPRDRQDEIFSGLDQGKGSGSANTDSGHGLEISRNLARGMRGDLRVRSKEGQGAVFTLSLPAP